MVEGGHAMNDRHPANRVWPLVVTAVVALIVAAVAYRAGIAHGLAISPQAAAAGWHPHFWFHPFGFLFPLFFLFLFVAFARIAFWRGPWRHGWHGGWSGPPPMFEDWHRQAHERMAAGDSRGSNPPGA
jgi:hypothetical protein